jgi:TRAP-type transport system small permease protein
MERLSKRFVDLVEWWSVLLLVLMVVVVSLGVFFRYALNSALAWYDEFASYLLVWLTFSAAVVASYRRRHIGFSLIVHNLGPGPRQIVEFIAEICVLSFQFVLFYYGWFLAHKMGDETAVSLVWVKMGWVYGILPVAGCLMLLISLGRIYHLVFGREY